MSERAVTSAKSVQSVAAMSEASEAASTRPGSRLPSTVMIRSRNISCSNKGKGLQVEAECHDEVVVEDGGHDGDDYGVRKEIVVVQKRGGGGSGAAAMASPISSPNAFDVHDGGRDSNRSSDSAPYRLSVETVSNDPTTPMPSLTLHHRARVDASDAEEGEGADGEGEGEGEGDGQGDDTINQQAPYPPPSPVPEGALWRWQWSANTQTWVQSFKRGLEAAAIEEKRQVVLRRRLSAEAKGTVYKGFDERFDSASRLKSAQKKG
ncbi:unnamed protein product [Vitrella brassicaformis CCMP3155]|uniref:Uncharacterized protein n=2 Tax=Vitrella brassicaformis TaxID=1169539 RepID=A0A0G4ERU5_VITBC|nr:unnamed protein product [Vitrella brassicaformis CCMP3155]|eukprot:CEM00617.1 unnamed protein product [Vitrella brassicaformis CCMP3155]